jgi:hypothetical protein
MRTSTESVRNLPFWWRVTRYDPARRDERGWYPVDDWVEYQEIGRTFHGETLTEETYLRVEDAYVAFLTDAAAELGVDEVELRGPEGLEDEAPAPDRIAADEAAAELLRSVIRGNVWWRFESPDNRFAVHVGHDMYMYFGSDREPLEAFQKAEASGLFVERIDGPRVIPG